MATIGKITLANSGTAATEYAEGKGKLKEETKNWLIDQGVDEDLVNSLNDRAVVMDGQNIDPEYAASEMKATRKAFGISGKETVRVIQSFPNTDLNPANPADWQRCNEMGLELAQKAFPDYQVAIYTHIDGEGHMVHNHLVVNMPNLTTGQKYNRHRDWEIVSEINDQISKEHGLSIINEMAYSERRTMGERKLADKGQYVWKDDLRTRIKTAISRMPDSDFYKSFPISNFNHELQKVGVDVRLRGETLTYSFVDDAGKKRISRDKKLGTQFTRFGLTRNVFDFDKATDIQPYVAPEPELEPEAPIAELAPIQAPEDDIFAQMEDIDSLDTNIEAKLQKTINKEVKYHATTKQRTEQIEQSANRTRADQSAPNLESTDETLDTTDFNQPDDLLRRDSRQHGPIVVNDLEGQKPNTKSATQAVELHQQSSLDKPQTRVGRSNAKSKTDGTIGHSKDEKVTQRNSNARLGLQHFIEHIQAQIKTIRERLERQLRETRYRIEQLKQTRQQSSVQPTNGQSELASRTLEQHTQEFRQIQQISRESGFNVGSTKEDRQFMERFDKRLSNQIKREQDGRSRNQQKELDPQVRRTAKTPTKSREQEMNFKRRNKAQNQEQER